MADKTKTTVLIEKIAKAHVSPISRLTLLLLASALWLGCAGQTRKEQESRQIGPVMAQLDNPFQLRVNQSAEVQSENLRITFLAVTEDSRCPEGAICVWEGQATVLLAISKDGKELGKYSLTSRAGHEELAILSVVGLDGYLVELTEVAPYPKLRQKIADEEYIITLVLSRI